MAFSVSTVAVGQVDELRQPQERPESQPDQQRILRQSVKPSFLIKPLVHRIDARRGQLLKFNFSIENNTEGVRLEIRPVAMIQRENGAILPDTENPPPEQIRLLTPKSVVLSEGEEHIIRCQMRVPVTNAPFLSYGVLVKEIPLQDNGPRGPQDEPRVGIKFVTQYLLRVDLTVLGARGDSVSLLQLDEGSLIQQEGRPRVRLFVDNPTDTAMEFGVKCHLRSLASGATGNSQSLAVPVRASQPIPARYDARILGQARLRMEEYLPDPVFPGDYELVAQLKFHGRTVGEQRFPIRIRQGDYPAQDASIVRVSKDIIVEPANVELSLRRGGSRIQTLTLRNNSLQHVNVDLRPLDANGEQADWYSVRPASMKLAPGRIRKVVITPGRRRDLTEHLYGAVGLNVTPEDGKAIGEKRIPVALLSRNDSPAELEPGEIRWKADSGRYGFVLPLVNQGGRHVPLEGRMTLIDDYGRGTAIEAGFGKWLLPGRDAEMLFLIQKFPPPGMYQMKITVNQGPGREPLELKQAVRLADPVEEKVSQQGPQDRR